MKMPLFLIPTGILIAAAGCVPPGVVTPREYNRFALKAADGEMWREAEYRLRQALAETPNDARIHNNLAVVLEAQEKLAEAYSEYATAVRLEPANDAYRRNLREFTLAHRWEYEAPADGGTTLDKEQ